MIDIVYSWVFYSPTSSIYFCNNTFNFLKITDVLNSIYYFMLATKFDEF